MFSDSCSDEEAFARRSMPGLKEDASKLLADWPEKPGTLPFSGQFSADRDNADFICIVGDVEMLLQTLLQTDPPPGTERVGAFIWRADGGGLRFDLHTASTKVEYHPSETVPASFVTTVRYCDKVGKVEHALERYVQLEPNWFLAWYSITDL